MRNNNVIRIQEPNDQDYHCVVCNKNRCGIQKFGIYDRQDKNIITFNICPVCLSIIYDNLNDYFIKGIDLSCGIL